MPWTQPPAELVNSPQTVLKGRRSPQGEAGGLQGARDSVSHAIVKPSSEERESEEEGDALLVDALDEGREDARGTVGRPSGEEDRVRVPVEAEDGRAQRLLEVLGDPPVALGVVLAHGDRARARRDGELLLVGRPAHEGRRAVDAQEDERRLPHGRARLWVRLERPHVGVAVVRARHEAVGLRRPVDRGDELVVLLQRVREGQPRSGSGSGDDEEGGSRGGAHLGEDMLQGPALAVKGVDVDLVRVGRHGNLCRRARERDQRVSPRWGGRGGR